ncbi:DDB1- and CUL4-associated factor 13 [Vitis vinifera]|uniref:DDB1-and CUL4-associated factor 13 n=1 Tax=Vitis vinifera TaxID=29760 RepID=A0A438EGC8_VITVI|nr:DDB1- and CUL4-associated factor 13 [Vitis vinifera]
MKVKVISRSTDEFTRERSQDLQVFPSFSFLSLEYLVFIVFARPFIGAMDGHIDSISCMAKNPNYLKGIFSGSMDGGILIIWRFSVHRFLNNEVVVVFLMIMVSNVICLVCFNNRVPMYKISRQHLDFHAVSNGAGDGVVGGVSVVGEVCEKS